MEDRKSKLKSVIKSILIVIFIFIVCFSNIFTKPIGNLDEIWNYNCAKNIANGLVPYKDISMVSMPLLFIICGLFLNIFGNQLIIMRLLAVILMVCVFFITYKILKLITNSEIALLSVTAFLLIFSKYMCIDYNYAALVVALLLLYIELKKSKENILNFNFKYDFIIGLIAGISILFKQTTGIAISLACAGYKIFAIRKKEEWKTFFKIFSVRLLGTLIPVIILILYLFFSGALNEFVNYTILGLKTFSNKIAYKNLLKNNFIIPIIVPIIMFIMFVLQFVKKPIKEIYALFAFAISSFVVVFPISDNIHFLIGTLIVYIAIIFLVWKCIVNNLKLNKKFKNIAYVLFNFLSMFLVLCLLYSSIIKINKDYLKVDKEKELAYFVGIPENKGLDERISEIDEYILNMNSNGKKVYILDSEAAIYNIPLNIYHKNYDMFLKGNLGADGEDGIIEKIKTEEDCVYLIKKSGLNWQNPNEVREYIMNNLKYIGDISIFYIYEK